MNRLHPMSMHLEGFFGMSGRASRSEFSRNAAIALAASAMLAFGFSFLGPALFACWTFGLIAFTVLLSPSLRRRMLDVGRGGKLLHLFFWLMPIVQLSAWLVWKYLNYSPAGSELPSGPSVGITTDFAFIEVSFYTTLLMFVFVATFAFAASQDGPNPNEVSS